MTLHLEKDKEGIQKYLDCIRLYAIGLERDKDFEEGVLDENESYFFVHFKKIQPSSNENLGDIRVLINKMTKKVRVERKGYDAGGPWDNEGYYFAKGAGLGIVLISTKHLLEEFYRLRGVC
jgi:hypothetical protein